MKRINERIDSIFLPMTIEEEDQMIIILNSKYKGKIRKAIDNITDEKIKKQLEQLYYSEKLLVDIEVSKGVYEILDSIDQQCWTCDRVYNLKADTKVITAKKSKELLRVIKELIPTEQDYEEETKLALQDLVKTGMCKFTKRIKQILNATRVNHKVKVLLSLKNKLKKLYQVSKFKIQILINKAQKIVSFSLGKDSTAMLIKLIEAGEKIDHIAFADTGMEFPEMFKYMKRVEKYIGRKIDIVKGKVTWEDWFYGKFTKGKTKGQRRGFPPVVGVGCWAKRELKIKPLRELEGKGNIIFLGIAADEQHRIYRNDYHTNNNIYRFPLVELGMTEQDCLSFLKEIGLENPLYKRFKRLGCWCCPKQPLDSLRKLFIFYPKKWEQLKKYEADSPIGFKPNVRLIDLEERFKKELSCEQLNFFDICSQCVNA